MNRKAQQLGMNPSTASGRLIKDLLFKFVTDSGHTCFRCGEPMTRDTFSIDHKTPWLHTNDPLATYFDLDNIAFSHKMCNSGIARRTRNPWTAREKLDHKLALNRKNYSPEKRHEQYVKHGH